LMELISAIRSLRAEMNIDPKRTLDAVLAISSENDKKLVQSNLPKLLALARLKKLEFSEAASGNLLRGVSRLGEFGLDVHDAINIAAERERMLKEVGKVKDEIGKILGKLNRPDFVERAPEAIVAENRARHDELLDRQRKLESNLARLPLE
jgi:valyl-tRNA synthetase